MNSAKSGSFFKDSPICEVFIPKINIIRGHRICICFSHEISWALLYYIAILLMANSLTLNSTCYLIFQNLSMIAHLYLKSNKQNSLIFISVNLIILYQVVISNSVYISILQAIIFDGWGLYWLKYVPQWEWEHSHQYNTQYNVTS